MAKHLNVSLAFTADTGKAQAQLKELQNTLNSLATTSGINRKKGFSEEIEKASKAAAQLQVQLKNATNVNTGTLDLGKFSESMARSQMSLAKYQQQLSALGSGGDKAFAQLARSISNAEIPLKRTNALTTELWTTLKNTARWQLSSSMLHGFMGTMQQAFGYAKDLNESLNNIRIVTGQSVEQMDAFAEKANQAAKSLNTTTTAYTDAALIFYQQGLGDKEVAERTEATIKMANVARESATDVSSYMTAIWNNFADGSKNLDYYGDVMTKLGAKTAASSAEIADGLEKFAAIGPTVGLSYENASAAVATVIDKTRQSADTVGTAFKTIFARLQGLQLGETLEDGVDLNKYSKALETVGVEVLDINGNLRDANDIINDLGMKWENLSRAQQTALAQTVAGTRQYTQLVALMQNFDAYQENVEAALNSEGTLDEQAEIYAESWEAARDRVRTSAEAIYSALINDDFFIDLNDTFAGFLDIVKGTIDGLGGLKGVLLAVGTIATQVFKTQIADSLGNLAYNIKMSTKAGREELVGMKNEANKLLVRQNFDQDTTSSRAQGMAYEMEGSARNAYLANVEKMSEEEREISSILLDRNKILGESVVLSGKELENAEDLSLKLMRQIELQKGRKPFGGKQQQLEKFGKRVGNIENTEDTISSSMQAIDTSKGAETQIKNLEKLKISLENVKSGYNEIGIQMNEALGPTAAKAFESLEMAVQSPQDNLLNLKIAMEEWNRVVSGSTGPLNAFEQVLQKTAQKMDLTEAEVNELRQAFINLGKVEGQHAVNSGSLKASTEQLKKFFMGANGETKKLSTALTQGASSIMAFGMTVSSVTGLIDTWKDSQASLGDKLISTTTTLGMVIPSVMQVAKGFEGAGEKLTAFGKTLPFTSVQLMLVVGAIAAVGVALYAMAKAAHEASPEGIFENAKKTAQEAASAAQEVADEYNNVKNSLDSLESGIDNIKSLERGTLEWRQAINESNEALIELLSTQGKLSKENFTVDKDGLMHLKEGVREDIEKEALQKLQSANTSKYLADMRVNDAESRVLASEKAGEGIAVMRESYAGGAQGQTYQYDAASSNSHLSADIGMAVAKGLSSGSIKVDDNGKFDTKGLTSALQEVSGLTTSEIDSIVEQVNSNTELQASLLELSGEVSANTEANKILAGEIGKNEFGDKIESTDLDEENQEKIAEMMGADVQKKAEELYESEYKDKGKLGGGKTDEEIQKEYAKLMGWDENNVDNQSGNKAEYFDKDGKSLGVRSDEAARRALAEQAAIKEIGGDVQGYVDNLKSLIEYGNKLSEGAGDAMSTFAGGDSGDLRGLNNKQLKDFREKFDAGEIDFSNWESLGYKSEEEYRKGFEAALVNAEGEVEALSENLIQPVKDALSKIADGKEFSVEDQKEISKSLNKANNAAGTKALDPLSKIMSSAGENADELASILNNTDFSSGDALDKINAALDEQGIKIDTTSQEWQDYISIMMQVETSIQSTFDALSAGFSTLNGLKEARAGDEINLEDYQQLIALYPELANAVIQVDEETFQLTQDMSTFLSSGENSLENLITKLNKYSEIANQIKMADSEGNTLLDTSGYNQLGSEEFNEMESSDQVAAYGDAFTAIGESEAGSAMYEQLGIADSYIKELVDSGNLEGLAQLKERIDDFLNSDTDTSKLQEQLAATAENLGELHDMAESGALDENSEAFAKAAEKLQNTLDEDVDVEQYERLADTIKDTAAESEDLADILAVDEEAAKDVSKAILRFDNAIQDIDENYEGWMETLESGDLGGMAEAVEGLSDAYGDLLDIDGSLLSEDFLTNADNLRLMKEAANGSQEAYEALAQAAAEDIFVNCGMDKTDFDTQYAALQTSLDEINFEDIEVGAYIDDTGIYQQMNQLINSANMTADEATAALASMGFDAVVSSTEVPKEKKEAFIDAVPYTTYEQVDVPTIVQGGDGATVENTKVNVPQINYKGESHFDIQEGQETVTALRIDSLRKGSGGGSVGGGNFKFKNAPHGGGTSGGGKGKSGGGKKGGGGGGSGSKAKEPKKENKKSFKKEKDRYHVVKNQLEDLEAQYDKIAKAKERAFGKAKLKLIDQEISKQKQLIEKQKEYLKQAQENLKLDKKEMSKYGAQFDANGTITNYEAMLKKQIDAYNQAVDKYNAMSGEAQENLDKEWSGKKDEYGEYYKGYLDYYERQYKEFTEHLEQYEETQDLVRDKQQEIIDAQNELYDLQLEKIEYKVDLQIDFSDEELEHLEYLLERIEDAGFKAADAIANLGLQTKALFNQSEGYTEGIKNIFANHGLSDSEFNKWMQGDKATIDKVSKIQLTESEVEALRDWTSGLRDVNESLIEVRKTVHDQLLETFDQWNEKIDKHIDKLDHLKSLTESYKNIIDLVGKENFAGSDEALAAINENLVQQSGDIAQANIANRDRIQQQLDATREAYAKQKDIISEEERKIWEDTISEMEEQLNEAEEEAMSSIEDWMDAINQKFITSIEKTMDDFSNKVAGKFKNLNELSEAFERQQKVDSRYLADYEKIYQFSKLNRDIENSIDNTSNIKAKQELAKLQKEINELEESGVEVSEYQMENLRKRYELKLAELSLEEAKNAKSEVRMTRDSEGNWGYVYTADEEMVAQAEQSYEDKLHELQVHNAEYINQLQDSIIQMQQEMAEKLAEIANDESLSIEEREAKMNEVQAYYQEQMKYYSSELELVLGNNKQLYEEDWKEYAERTDYKISEDEKYVDSFEETNYSILTGFKTMEEAQQAFNEASNALLEESKGAFDTWESDMRDGPLSAMGTDFENLSDKIREEMKEISDESEETGKQIEKDTQEAVDNYQGVVDAIIAWENQYSQSVEAMIQMSDNLIDKFQQILALWADVKSAAAEEPPKPPSEQEGSGSGSGGGSGSGSGGGGGNAGKPSWDRVVAAYDKINQGKWGVGIGTRIRRGAADGFSEAEVRAGQQLINYTYPPRLNGMGYSREKAKGLMGYDTGGYTGVWGDSSGKLALLHQKEIVLNKEDTENFLSAIEIVRQISSMIDLNAMSSMRGITSILSAGGVGQPADNGIQQNIEIHAEFPDATDHSEIEEAFNNLLNSASQYANRKL